jgi:hypothetical protein
MNATRSMLDDVITKQLLRYRLVQKMEEGRLKTEVQATLVIRGLTEVGKHSAN